MSGVGSGETAAVARPGQDPNGQSLSTVAFLRRKVERHLRWGREQGWARLIEEDRLDPRDRIVSSASKTAWRLIHGHRGRARAVFIVGLQRSGTNMFVRALDEAPYIRVRNENDRRAFHRYRLRDSDTVESLVARSPYRAVVFKPLADSHRVRELLDGGQRTPEARAIWMFRSVEGRARSSLAKFGDHDLQVARMLMDGRTAGLWQAGGLSEERLRDLRHLRGVHLSSADGSALLWYLRNGLYFDLGLDDRSDVRLLSYEAFIRDPAREMTRVCSFLGLPYLPQMVGQIDARSSRPPGLELHPAVAERCRRLGSRLSEAYEAETASLLESQL